MTIGENEGYRVNLKPADDVEIIKVELDGKDITSELNGNTIILPKMNNSGRLKIYRKSNSSSSDSISIEPEEQKESAIYNLQGITVTNPGHGIYIKDAAYFGGIIFSAHGQAEVQSLRDWGVEGR